MAAIIIDIECRDRLGKDTHFATVVKSIKDIHGALMDCLNEIRTFGWAYLGHTKTIHEGKVEKSTIAYIKELKKTIEKQYKKIQKLERKKNG